MTGYPPVFGPVCRGGACPARGYTWALVYGEGSGPGMPGPYAVGADSISARGACHCRRRPRATNGRPYTCNKAGMQFLTV